MTDIFDNTILCKKCKKEMKPVKLEKDGFVLRALECEKCKAKVLHPTDEQEYNKYINLKNKNLKTQIILF